MGAISHHGEGDANQLGSQDADGPIIRKIFLVELPFEDSPPLGRVLSQIPSYQPHDTAPILGAQLGQVGGAGRFIGRLGDGWVKAKPCNDAFHLSEPAGVTQLPEEGTDEDRSEIGDLIQVMLKG